MYVHPLAPAIHGPSGATNVRPRSRICTPSSLNNDKNSPSPRECFFLHFLYQVGHQVGLDEVLVFGRGLGIVPVAHHTRSLSVTFSM